MGSNSVIIKSNKYGLVVILDDILPFEELLKDIAVKFRESSNFFKNAQMAITFEGRELTKDQEREIIYTITDNSKIHIICVVDGNKENERYFQKAVTDKLSEIATHDGQFYKGTLRSGQILESETSIIILGDVNHGSNVISKGNIIVLGACRGNIYAGAAGNNGCFVAALSMKPMQIRIGDRAARSAITKWSNDKEKEFEMDPRIAFVKEGHIIVKPIGKDALDDISL